MNMLVAATRYLLVPASAVFLMAGAQATTIGTAAHYTAVPPLVDLAGSGDKPNILVILDNSNSMDEAASGVAVGSDNVNSKSEIARNAVKDVVNNFGDFTRLGLMSYQQEDVDPGHIHNSQSDASFVPANFDPLFNGSRDSLTKKFRTPNSSNLGEYIYYNVALPFYSGSSLGTAFCRSLTANFDNGSETYIDGSGPPVDGPWDTYECYQDKTDTTDNYNSGFSNLRFVTGLIPTDSDVAQGILDFGTFFTWQHVGPTWFSDSSPGKGMLHVEIDDVDASHKAKLLNKLATSQFASATDTPLRNAGLTPLVGTLQSARTYFGGSLPNSEAEAGVPTSLPPANVCSANNDFVVLVTDGLPSVDASGNAVSNTVTAIAAAAAEAAQLLAAGVRTYVVGFALPSGVDPTLLDQIAAAGGTTIAYRADDPATLNSALSSIFLNISNRTSSATGAAVSASSAQGGGAVFLASFTPKLIDSSGREVNWVGELSGIFLDENGFFREDTNGNKTLDGYDTDATVVYFYDTSVVPNRTRIRSYLSASPVIAPDISDPLTPSTTIEASELGVLWQARDQLATLTNTTTQRAYTNSAATGRHVLTSVDGRNLSNFVSLSPAELATLATAEANALVALNIAKADVIAAVGQPQAIIDAADLALANAQNDYDAASLAALNGTFLNYLMESSGTQANTLVNYIRGEEQPGYRSREIDIGSTLAPRVITWRLGDIVHSTPTLVEAPVENYDVLYDDTTYAAFRNQYKDRRHVIYVGANDGMLHAFNAGFWNEGAKKYELDDSYAGGTGLTQHPLGAELWSYIPRSALPHLRWLKDSGYTHSYYVDGEPKVFDANIFAPDADHPHGWGTVLVVGMRLGGGTINVDSDGDSVTDTTTHSSYIIMDVTNPEAPPQLIAEVSHESLGFTTSEIGLVKKRVAQTGSNFTTTSANSWQLVFGSGPNQLSDVTATTVTTPTTGGNIVNSGTAKLFVYDLVTRGFVSGFAPRDLSIADSFIGSVEVANWDGDYIDDTAYFGVIGGSPSLPTGKLMRYRPDQPITSDISTLIDTTRATVGHPLPVVDGNGRKWVHFGTGRLFSDGDNLSVPLQRFYGVMEPVDNTDTETWATVSSSTLEDVTDIRVFKDGYIDDLNGGTIEIPSGTTLSIFDELKSALPQHKGGWFRDLNPSTGAADPSGRNVNYAIKIKDLVLFVEYTPSGIACQPEGTSDLNAVHFQTGTAVPRGALGFDTNIQNINSEPLSMIKEYMGQGLFGHLQRVKNKVIATTSAGGGVGIDVNLGSAPRGRQSWVEIELE